MRETEHCRVLQEKNITPKDKQSCHSCCDHREQSWEQPVPNKHTDKSSPLLMGKAYLKAKCLSRAVLLSKEGTVAKRVHIENTKGSTRLAFSETRNFRL